MYVREWSDFIRRDADDNILLDSRAIEPPALGSAIWSPPLPPHSPENIGNATVHVVSVELKNAD